MRFKAGVNLYKLSLRQTMYTCKFFKDLGIDAYQVEWDWWSKFIIIDMNSMLWLITFPGLDIKSKIC